MRGESTAYVLELLPAPSHPLQPRDAQSWLETSFGAYMALARHRAQPPYQGDGLALWKLLSDIETLTRAAAQALRTGEPVTIERDPSDVAADCRARLLAEILVHPQVQSIEEPTDEIDAVLRALRETLLAELGSVEASASLRRKDRAAHAALAPRSR